MIKLYRRADGGTDYWETWDTGEGTAIEHWGRLGTTGEDRTVSPEQAADDMTRMCALGYAKIADDELYGIEVIYEIDGFGTAGDLDKRHRLEDRLDQLLGWTGLGHMDGGSIGSGSMEIFVYVVDSEIGRRVIEQNLASTEFADYARIVVHPPVSEDAV